MSELKNFMDRNFPDRSEYDHQVAIFEWSERMESTWPELKLMTGSIMGIRLSPRQLNKLIKSGMKKGKPDIQLPVARRNYIGLAIELKTKKGRLSKEQKRFLERLGREGHYACMCRGSNAAIVVIEWYLKGKKTL